MRTSSKYEERNHSVARFDCETREAHEDFKIGMSDMFLGAWIAVLLIAAAKAETIADLIYVGWM